MDRGALVPDEVILGIVGDALEAPSYTKGVILDGVVRTVPQAIGLRDAFYGPRSPEVDAVLCFDISNDEIVRSACAVVSCAPTAKPLHGEGAVGDTCAKCGGKLMRRKDDEPEAIRKRLEVFDQQTAPVLEWYKTHKTTVAVVDATGTVEEVTARALRALGR